MLQSFQYCLRLRCTTADLSGCDKRLDGPQSPKYVHSGPLQKQSAAARLQLNISEGWWASQRPMPPWLAFSNLPLAPASPALQHSSFFQRIWPLLMHVAPVLSLPSAYPSHQAGPGRGPSRWLESTSCLTCSPPGLSRNGRA